MQAVEDYMQHESLGKPTVGGIDDQEAEWVDSITCTTSAISKVKHLVEQEMQAEQEKKAKEQQRRKKR